MTFFTGLVCTRCGRPHSGRELQNLCRDPECAKPLFACYDNLKPIPRSILDGRPATMWRYREMMPVSDEADIISLGEGFTPLLPARNLGRRLGMEGVMIKDEALNPTGSFKARGLAAAVTMARRLGAEKCIIPPAGNAGGAMSAYCARAGLPACVYMPTDTPEVFKTECRYYGAEVNLVDGLITDCGRLVRQRREAEGWFDVSTLKEPYRVEGKKTMGYELAEQLGWELPDVIIYPTGGGTGLIGMWKAFDEMERLGWIGSRRPRMVAVQAAGCAPIPRAFEAGEEFAAFFENAHTLASGLRVPAAVGDFLILRAIRASGGTALTVTDDELIAGVREMAADEGVFAAPEGGATWAALKKMAAGGLVAPGERVVLFNTGTAYKYLDNMPDLA